jgi:hypothetical protein
MTPNNEPEMDELWDSSLSKTEELQAISVLDHLGYEPEEIEDLGEETRDELYRLCDEFYEIQEEFSRRDSMDRQLLEEKNRQEDQIIELMKDQGAETENWYSRREFKALLGLSGLAALGGVGSSFYGALNTAQNEQIKNELENQPQEQFQNLHYVDPALEEIQENNPDYQGQIEEIIALEGEVVTIEYNENSDDFVAKTSPNEYTEISEDTYKLLEEEKK